MTAYAEPYSRLYEESRPADPTCPICEEVKELCGNCNYCAACHDPQCICPDFEEDACPIQVDLDAHCGQPITRIVFEPYTPARFKARCCASCAESLISQGYLREVK